MNKVKVNNTTQALMIDGASCASCVSKIETALLSIEGVDRAQMNFTQRTVLVTGHANIDELIKTVEAIGYNAKSSNNASDEQLLNEKEVADQKYYRRLIQQMWVSLGLGAPLMI
ncbi:MAG: cation transporter, partial [Colwellia sp.]